MCVERGEREGRGRGEGENRGPCESAGGEQLAAENVHTAHITAFRVAAKLQAGGW